MTTIREAQEMVHALAVRKGWWDNDPKDANSVAAKLALIHSEVSEALEEVRDSEDLTEVEVVRGKLVGFSTELADVVIRVLDLASALGIDLQDAIERKHRYNETRTHRHGGRRL